MSALAQWDELDDSLDLADGWSWSLDVILLVGISNQGMRSTQHFRRDFARLSSQGRVGTTHELGTRFCKANHYQIAVPVPGKKGKTSLWFVAELWSLPFVYRWEPDGKPLLEGILPAGAHTRYVGRSIKRPAWCDRPTAVDAALKAARDYANKAQKPSSGRTK